MHIYIYIYIYTCINVHIQDIKEYIQIIKLMNEFDFNIHIY